MKQHRSYKNFAKMVVIAGAGLALMVPALPGSAIGFAQTPVLSTPSALNLGWQVSCQVYAFRGRNFFEMIDILSSMGILNIEGLNLPGLKMSSSDNTVVDHTMSKDKQDKVKKYLADKGMKMPSYYVGWGKEAWLKDRKLWEFLKTMGVEVLNCEMAPGDLAGVEKLSQEFKIPMAIHNHTQGTSPVYYDWEKAIKALDGAGTLPHVGFCPDLGQWGRSNIDVLKGISAYHKSRPIHVVHARDLRKNGDADTVLGTGRIPCGKVLDSLYAWKWKGIITFDPDLQSKNLNWIIDSCARFVENYAKTKNVSSFSPHSPSACFRKGGARLLFATGDDVSIRNYRENVFYDLSGKIIGGKDPGFPSSKAVQAPGVYIVR